ncbi:MAG: AraC family transcriptional regulator [Blautia sp.]|nr:AraC family transcriptional regulator [Blautia sp.]
MPENISRLEEAFRSALYQMSPLSECVSLITVRNADSRMFLCRPWKDILLWANKVGDRHLPYGGAEMGNYFASLNYCISGRCEVCLPDETYIYMEPGMLCIDNHTPKDGYWYPGQSYVGVEIVFDMDQLSEHPIRELSAYCDYDGWVREMLSTHGGTYLGAVGSECDRLMNLLCSHLEAADWNLRDLRLHLLLLLYALANGGSVPVMDRFYVTKGQKHIADEVEQMITGDLSRHYTVTDMAAMYGISPSALKKYFEAVYGLPISFYLREKRMLLAKKRLSETKDSVGMVAAACGYTNQGKFGSAFREYTGMSPLEYRRLNYKEKGG